MAKLKGATGALDMIGAVMGKKGFKQSQDPRVAKALEDYLKGDISEAERIAAVRELMPIRPLTELPPAYTDEEIIRSLMANKQSKALAPVEPGSIVGNRLDIPAYEQHGIYVDTTHLGGKGSPISYGRTGHLRDVTFESSPGQAARVGLGTKEQALTPMGAEMGSGKSPFAVIKGRHQGTSDEDVRRMAQEYLKDPEWAQIGMNPYRHSQFYDKSDMSPVWSAEEKLQIGPLILAPRRGLEKTSWDDPRLSLEKFPGKRYAHGGLAYLAGGGVAKKMFQQLYRGYAGEPGKEEIFASPQRKVAEYYANKRAAQTGGEPGVEAVQVDPFAGKQYGHSLPIDEFNRDVVITQARKLSPLDVLTPKPNKFADYNMAIIRQAEEGRKKREQMQKNLSDWYQTQSQIHTVPRPPVNVGSGIADLADKMEAYINEAKSSGMKAGGSSTPAWQRKEGKNPEGGLNAAGRASYNRETGGNLKPPVSSEQAKKSPKSAARRKSFCARMSGNPGPMKDENGKPTRKALALRKWDC